MSRPLRQTARENKEFVVTVTIVVVWNIEPIPRYEVSGRSGPALTEKMDDQSFVPTSCRDPVASRPKLHQRATRLETFSLVFACPLVRIYTSSVPVLIPSVSTAGFRQVVLLMSSGGPGTKRSFPFRMVTPFSSVATADGCQIATVL